MYYFKVLFILHINEVYFETEFTIEKRFNLKFCFKTFVPQELSLNDLRTYKCFIVIILTYSIKLTLKLNLMISKL